MQEKFALEFVDKMKYFFQEMRDMCRDYVITTQRELQKSQPKIQKRPEELQQPNKLKVDQSRPPIQVGEKIKNQSPFTLFFQERKRSYLQNHPELPMKTIIEMSNKEWHTLSEEKQKPYILKYQELLRKEDRAQFTISKPSQEIEIKSYEDENSESESFGDVIQKQVKL